MLNYTYDAEEVKVFLREVIPGHDQANDMPHAESIVVPPDGAKKNQEVWPESSKPPNIPDFINKLYAEGARNEVIAIQLRMVFNLTYLEIVRELKNGDNNTHVTVNALTQRGKRLCDKGKRILDESKKQSHHENVTMAQ